MSKENTKQKPNAKKKPQHTLKKKKTINKSVALKPTKKIHLALHNVEKIQQESKHKTKVLDAMTDVIIAMQQLVLAIKEDVEKKRK